jgi:hypothetical protein
MQAQIKTLYEQGYSIRRIANFKAFTQDRAEVFGIIGGTGH